MRQFYGVLIAASLMVMGSCADTNMDRTDSRLAQAQLKEKAQAEVIGTGGKNDQGEDVCEVYGFYSDGFCDFWCAQPDSDCGPCDGPSLKCEANELALDTNDTGCADTCVENPDYRPPHQVALGEPCSYEDDCEKDVAYCAKDMGRCDDGEPGTCTLRPDCGGAEDFQLALVCGCNGDSRANACEAHAMGMNLRHDGLCED